MDSTEHKKKAVLVALESSLGVVTSACAKAGIGRTQFYNWMKEDPAFKQQVDELENVAFDFVESQLYKQIQDNNTAATIFWLKTKGKNRGYSERTEITGRDGESLTPFQIIIPPKHD